MSRNLVALPAICCAAIFAAAAMGDGHLRLGCGNCHVAHRSAGNGESGILWNTANTDDGLPVFTLYGSRSFDALGTDISQPDGSSRLCLGCHDGSYSGMGANRRAIFSPAALAQTHPVSFTYDSSLAARTPGGALRDPAVTPSGLGGSIQQDLLDEKGKVQCSSCHDVHRTGKGSSHLRYDYDAASQTNRLCQICHNR